jgi:oxalate decarboxylase
MTNAVLGNTYDLPGSAFDAFERKPSEQIIRRPGSHSVSPTERFPNAHLFDLEGQHAPLSYAYGSVRFARNQFWAALDDLSMCSLRVKETACGNRTGTQ